MPMCIGSCVAHVTCECRPADEDEIEKALRKISKFVIFDLQKIVNSFAKARSIAVKFQIRVEIV